MLTFPCWGCGKTLKAKEEHAGKKAKCKGCNRLNSIPGVQVASTPTTPSAANSSSDNDLPVAPVDPAVPDDDDRDAVILSKRKGQSMRTADLYSDVDSASLGSPWAALGRAFLVVILVVSVLGLLNFLIMDVTVPQYSDAYMQEVTGGHRYYNSVLAQRQTSGLIATGVLSMVCVVSLFLLRSKSKS